MSIQARAFACTVKRIMPACVLWTASGHIYICTENLIPLYCDADILSLCWAEASPYLSMLALANSQGVIYEQSAQELSLNTPLISMFKNRIPVSPG